MFKAGIAIIALALTAIFGGGFITSQADSLPQVAEQLAPTIEKKSTIDGVHIPDEIWDAVPDGLLG